MTVKRQGGVLHFLLCYLATPGKTFIDICTCIPAAHCGLGKTAGAPMPAEGCKYMRRGQHLGLERCLFSAVGMARAGAFAPDDNQQRRFLITLCQITQVIQIWISEISIKRPRTVHFFAVIWLFLQALMWTNESTKTLILFAPSPSSFK